jgi:PilZ domain
MPQSAPRHLLELALRLLPELPARVQALCADGGIAEVRPAHANGELLGGYAAVSQMRLRLGLRVRLGDGGRAGHDVDLEVAEIVPHSTTEAIVLLRVSSVTEHRSVRAADRVGIGGRASVSALRSQRLQRGAAFDADLVDLSTSGLAFDSEREIELGDVLAVEASVYDRPVPIEVRVVRRSRPAFGRRRYGCEVVTVTDEGRVAIELLTMAAAARAHRAAPIDADPGHDRRLAARHDLLSRLRPTE